MITFPSYFFLLPYALVLAVILFFYLVNIGHLFQTGLTTFASFLLTAFFLTYSVIVVNITWNAISSTDWQEPATIQFSGINQESI